MPVLPRYCGSHSLRFHFIRDLFRTRKISAEYVTLAEQFAGVLSKALSRVNFQFHHKHLMIFRNKVL